MADTNGGRIWLKLALAFVPLAVAGLVGYGALRSEVQGNRAVLADKANRETVEAQNREVLRSLDAIRQDIQELRRLIAGRRP